MRPYYRGFFSLYSILATKAIKRGLSTSSYKAAIHNVTIVGGGRMGAGIAQISAQIGNDVTLLDVNPDLLKKAESSISNNLDIAARKLYKSDTRAAAEFFERTRSRIRGSTDPSQAVSDSDLVVETIVEKLEVKHNLFRILDLAAPSRTIFATNSSLLSIDDISSITTRKDRFGGLHFFDPVPDTKLLEVVKIPETSQETHQSLLDWGKTIGKTCITCKDSPGFVVNRLLVPYIAEAIRMIERGESTARDIDTAMKLGAGHPMGPIELADYLGHDTTLQYLETWLAKSPENPLFNPCETLRELVRAGKLGKKAGEGFYKYNNLKYWLENHANRIDDKRKWVKYFRIWQTNMNQRRRSTHSLY